MREGEAQCAESGELRRECLCLCCEGRWIHFPAHLGLLLDNQRHDSDGCHKESCSCKALIYKYRTRQQQSPNLQQARGFACMRVSETALSPEVIREKNVRCFVACKLAMLYISKPQKRGLYIMEKLVTGSPSNTGSS